MNPNELTPKIMDKEPTLFDPPFTQEQIEFLSELIRTELKSQSLPKPTPPPPFHSLPELRELIECNLHDLYVEFGDKPFRLPTLAHVLSRYATLRPGDQQLQKGVSRWENQVGQVVLCEDRKWAANGNPFESVEGGVRGCYRLAQWVILKGSALS